MNKKFYVKIPSNILVILKNNRILYIKGPLSEKIIKFKLKLYMIDERYVYISDKSFVRLQNNELKRIDEVRGLIKAIIKQSIIDTSFKIYKKIKFVGVGYRAIYEESVSTNVLTVKLGYSHPLYFKTSKTLKMYCLKRTIVFILGDSYLTTTQAAANIRAQRKPEPYKGKGVLYNNEVIKLKEGKKV